MRQLHLWAVCGLLALALTACATPTPSQDSGDASRQEAIGLLQQRNAVQCDPGKEHWRAQGLPKRGRTATIGGLATYRHLDLTQPGISQANFPQLYDSLVKPRACYWEDLAMVPSLAKSWEVSADGRTWTLRLRDDVKWHNRPPVNGRLFTSADVLWSIQHQQAGGQVRYLWEGVTAEAPDKYTVVLRLPQPRADFLLHLGFMHNVILPREIKEQFGDFKTLALGTGAYILTDHTPGQSSILQRNPDYYEKGQDGASLPYLDQLRVLAFDDYVAEVAAIRAGQLDHNSAVGLRRVEDEALKQSNPKYRFYTTIHASNYGLLMNITRKPFDDVRVRRALALAIDANEWNDGQFKGSAVRTGFMPITLKEFAWPQQKVQDKFKPDLERAKKLLAEAGYGPGQLEFTIAGSASFNDLGEVAQQQLSRIGVKTVLNTPPGIRASAQLFPISPDKGFEATVGYLVTSTPFPSFWMDDVLRSYLRYDDPKFAQLANAQNKEMDPTKRKQIIDELQEHLYEVMPYVPTFSLTSGRVQSCQLKNMRPSSQSHNQEGLQQAWIDSAGC